MGERGKGGTGCGGVHAVAVKRVSLSPHCHSQSHGAKGPEMEPRQRLAAGSCHRVCLVAAKLAASAQWSEVRCIGDTDGCLCVCFALLAVRLVVYAPGTPMCLRVGFISR